MVSGPPGFALALVIVGTAALLTLLFVQVWPKSSDLPERAAARFLRAWRRFTGFDDADRGRARES